MVNYSYREIKEFKKFLIKKLGIKAKVKLRLLKKYGYVGLPDGTIACATYDADTREILLPLKQSKDMLYGCLAHEFAHVWQLDNNKEANEDEADNIALKLVEEYFGIKMIIEKLKEGEE